MNWTNARRALLEWSSPLVLLAMLAAPIALDAADDRVTSAFQTLDSDADGRLTVEEYLKRSGRREVYLRDLMVFDFDGNQRLSLQEFAAIPGLAPPHERGAIPDPFEGLRDQALEALDESYGNWDQNPTLAIPAGSFANAFGQSLGTEKTRTAVLNAAVRCDSSGDGRISRDEARGFVERQLGMVTDDGDSIRLPNGRLLDPGRFTWLDIDKSGEITAEEYAARYVGGSPQAVQDFLKADQTQDQRVDWAEYSDPRVPLSHNDLVDRFCKADKDLDGRLSAEELPGAVNTSVREIAPRFMPAFDDDGDGHWSLQEFQLSVFGGPITAWNLLRKDEDRNLSLSFDEFLYNREQYLLLQRLYFYRFDADGDGQLSAAEFPFEENPPNSLYRLAADGSVFELIWRDKTLPNVGSPEVSPDEKWIAFDLYPDRKIMLLDLPGGSVTTVGNGLMPTWSLDSERLALSHNGVQISDRKGVQSEQFAPGWGAQWSPDGKFIAYELNNGLSVYDVDKQAAREVLKAGEHPYQTLYYGMTWSPDSRRVALKGVNGNQNDLISVDTQGATADLKVHFSTPLALSHDLAWSPDGKRLLFAFKSEQHGRNLLHQLDLEAGGQPTIFPGIDEKLTYLGQSYSRDGTWIVVVAK